MPNVKITFLNASVFLSFLLNLGVKRSIELIEMKRYSLYAVIAATCLTSCVADFNFGMGNDLISPKIAELPASSQVFTFEVKDIVDWNVTLKQGTWVRIAIADMDLKKVIISADASNIMEERRDTLVFTANEKVTEIPIVQAGMSSIFSTNHMLFNGVESQVLTVNAERDWSVKIAQAAEHNWLTLSPTGATGLEVKTLEENLNVGGRDAVIRFTIGPDVYDIKVTQAQTDALIGEEESFDLDYKAQNLTVNVQTNVAYEIEIVGDWISRVDTKALNRVSELFAVDKNETEADRDGKIILKYQDLTQVVEIHQVSRIAPLLKLPYGVFNERGDVFVTYVKGKHQLSRLSNTTASFRMIDVNENSYIDMSGIPADIRLGSRFSLSLNYNLSLSLKNKYDVKVGWIDGPKYWLLTEEGIVFVVKK